MKYYSVSNSTGKETGRSYPQMHCLTQPYAHLMSAWEFPDFNPKLIFELEKGAKLTDVLSQASISAKGFLVNDKVKEVLSKFKLMTHRYYDASIYLPKSGETLNYYWLHLCQPELSHQLDYTKSVFYETEGGQVKVVRSFRPMGSEISVINYSYNSKGQLIEWREKFSQPENDQPKESKQTFEYYADGNVKRMMYYLKMTNDGPFVLN